MDTSGSIPRRPARAQLLRADSTAKHQQGPHADPGIQADFQACEVLKQCGILAIRPFGWLCTSKPPKEFLPTVPQNHEVSKSDMLSASMTLRTKQGNTKTPRATPKKKQSLKTRSKAKNSYSGIRELRQASPRLCVVLMLFRWYCTALVGFLGTFCCSSDAFVQSLVCKALCSWHSLLT